MPLTVPERSSSIVTIANRLGLHARPAMLLAETAMRFKAEILVRRLDQNKSVDGKSIMQLMMLQGRKSLIE